MSSGRALMFANRRVMPRSRTLASNAGSSSNAVMSMSGTALSRPRERRAGGSPRRRCRARGAARAARCRALAAAIDSTKAIRATPAAAGSRPLTIVRSGTTNSGSPGGIEPTRWTPRSTSPVPAAASMPRATTSRGPGTNVDPSDAPRRMAMLAAASIAVAQLIAPRFLSAEPDLAEEVVAFLRHPEHLAQLSRGDEQTGSRLEPDLDRRGDEVGQEATRVVGS